MPMIMMTVMIKLVVRTTVDLRPGAGSCELRLWACIYKKSFIRNEKSCLDEKPHEQIAENTPDARCL